jgi:hypothetical protein
MFLLNNSPAGTAPALPGFLYSKAGSLTLGFDQSERNLMARLKYFRQVEPYSMRHTYSVWRME